MKNMLIITRKIILVKFVNGMYRFFIKIKKNNKPIYNIIFQNLICLPFVMIGAESLNTVLKCKQLYSIKNMYTDQSYKYGPLKSKSLIIIYKSLSPL